MSISPTIDSRYRLTPRDLGRQDHIVTIGNVSWQGVENLMPLLHLQEFPAKRLVLDAAQQQELIQVLGTHQVNEWIGCQIMIAAQSDSDRLRIHLFAPPVTQQTRRQRGSAEIRIPESIRATVILLILLVALFLLVALLEQSDGPFQWLFN